jgi:hypothetical protein
VIWEDLSQRRRDKIITKARKLGEKYKVIQPAKMSLKTHLKFKMCKIIQNSAFKKSKTKTADIIYWIEQGWLKSVK